MKKGNAFLGGFLIAIGCLFLVLRYVFEIEIRLFEPGDFWPLIILQLGVTFELIYFTTGSKPGLLVPGGILTTLGCLFFFEVATNWNFAEYNWPVYILSVAIGLFQLYMFGGKKKGLLIATFILSIISAISVITILFEAFLTNVDLGLVIPIGLIAIGLIMFFGRKHNNNTW
jgi:hypothetical protein